MGQSVYVNQMGVFQIVDVNDLDCARFCGAASHPYTLAEPRFLKAYRGVLKVTAWRIVAKAT